MSATHKNLGQLGSISVSVCFFITRTPDKNRESLEIRGVEGEEVGETRFPQLRKHLTFNMLIIRIIIGSKIY